MFKNKQKTTPPTKTKNFCIPVSYRRRWHWQVGKTRDVSLHLAGYPYETTILGFLSLASPCCQLLALLPSLCAECKHLPSG